MTQEEKNKQTEADLAKAIAENAEKDALIAELQDALSKADMSSLTVRTIPTVTYKGETYEVRAQKFYIGQRQCEVADLVDSSLVAQAITDGLGWLVKIDKPTKTAKKDV